MTEIGTWNEEFGDGTGGGKSGDNNSEDRIPYMKLVSVGPPAVVRLVGKPVCFRRFVRKTASGFRNAVCNKDSSISSKYDINMGVRFAMHVIDRADNVLKILEFGVKIYNVFKSYKDMTGNMPGGPDGADFSIEKTGAGLATKYKTQKVGSVSKFTDEEKKMIVAAGNIPALEANLKERYKALPDDEIERILFGDGSENTEVATAPAPQEQAQVETVQAPAEDVVVEESEDLQF